MLCKANFTEGSNLTSNNGQCDSQDNRTDNQISKHCCCMYLTTKTRCNQKKNSANMIIPNQATFRPTKGLILICSLAF